MPLHRSDLGLLLALDALLAELNVTRAAARLGLSQPALSAQLARLRELFGDPLLVASGRRMLPTPRALALAEDLHRLLGELDGLVRDHRPFDAATAEHRFRIAATDYLHHAVATGSLTDLAREAPNVGIALVAFDPALAWKQLEDGAVDIVIASERLTPPQAPSRALFDETFVFVQRKGHPRGAGALTLDQICAFDHVLFSPDGAGFVGATDEALAAVGRRRRVVLSVPNVLLIPPLLAASDLVAVMPARPALAHRDTLDSFEPPLALPRFTVRAAWHPRRARDPAHRWLRERLAAPLPGQSYPRAL